MQDAVRDPHLRVYVAKDCAAFCRVADRHGGLSNMASTYPLLVNDAVVPSSEALYQALRHPHRPDVQRAIIEARSPMGAKAAARGSVGDTRPDWGSIRVAAMRFVLRVKLACNHSRVLTLLADTGEMPIVEVSVRDDWWGARPDAHGRLVGRNVLGRLLMELRRDALTNGLDMLRVAPPDVPDLLLLGRPLTIVDAETCDVPRLL